MELISKKEGVRYFWLLQLYYIRQDTFETFTLSELERRLGYHYPQPTLREEIFTTLITNGSLIALNSTAKYSRYRIDKKKLAHYIIKNQLFLFQRSFLKDETIFFGA